MYYLLKVKQNNEIEIIDNVVKEGLKIVTLDRILKQDNIKIIDDVSELNKAGIYAIKHCLDTYRLFRYVTETDGFLFYGSRYEVDVAYLKFVYYVNKFDDMEGISTELSTMNLKEKAEDVRRKDRLKEMEEKQNS